MNLIRTLTVAAVLVMIFDQTEASALLQVGQPEAAALQGKEGLHLQEGAGGRQQIAPVTRTVLIWNPPERLLGAKQRQLGQYVVVVNET